MSHYEQRLEQDLDRIGQLVADLSVRAQAAIGQSIQALLTGDEPTAHAIVLGDPPINRAMRGIDRQCHAFIARHLPSAGHLRYISAVIRVNVALERIGDYAVTIARESLQLSSPPEGALGRAIELIADEAKRMLAQATQSFETSNAEMARATVPMADNAEQTFDSVYADLLTDQASRQPHEMVALFAVFNMLKRVLDQAKNICEETLFAVDGEVKARKLYRVLFVDRRNAVQSPLAEAVALRQYAHAGEFSSAGSEPADALDPATVRFLADHGIEAPDGVPRKLDTDQKALAVNHVIVSLDGPVRDYVSQLPFHTAAVEWEISKVPEGAGADAQNLALDQIYREVSSNLGELMALLWGEDEA